MNTDEHGWGGETLVARIFTKQDGNTVAKNAEKPKNADGLSIGETQNY